MTRPTEGVASPAGLARDRSKPGMPSLSHRIAEVFPRVALTVATIAFVGVMASGWPSQASAHSESQKARAGQSRAVASARHVGYASYYARKFAGRKMADGTPMRPESDNAASLTLPLGSKAMVTNLRNGRTALVTIRDRGPFIRGRIIDVSPSTAKLLGILHVGVAKVAVVPLDKLPVEEKLEAIIAAAEAGESRVQLAAP